MQNQQILLGIVVMLVIVIGLLAYGRQQSHDTLGEKIGHTIDNATGARSVK
jgi:hypothetical protein